MDDGKSEYMTPTEVAELARWASNRTVRNWTKLGRFKPRKHNSKTVLFKRSEVVAALERYEHGNPDPPHDASMG